VIGDLFAVANQAGETVADRRVPPEALADLVELVDSGVINPTTGRDILAEMYATGEHPVRIIESKGLKQVSDVVFISNIVGEVLAEHPQEVESYRAGKTGVLNYLFGQAMKKAAGKANPAVVKTELNKQLG
jgi:aspartyl-tRNA(Asn)/glutamyl-tRNA(Gln) amidotransferase subunit B